MLFLLSSLAFAATWPTGDAPAPWTTDALGVQLQDVAVGDGPEVVEGAEATVEYTGLLADGTVFDTTSDRGTPFTFRVGQHAVIRGWEDGVVGMRVGGTRRLVIPPELGYGSRTVGPIPADAVLYFEIRLVSVTPPRATPTSPATVADQDWVALDDGLRYADLQPGDGGKVKKGRRVCVDWVAWTDGAVSDSTWARARCTWLTQGAHDLPAALEDAVVGMRPGGVRQVAEADGHRIWQVTLSDTGK
jgi:FKBP-type peptidyl-prolyl cis-trans isomerase